MFRSSLIAAGMIVAFGAAGLAQEPPRAPSLGIAGERSPSLQAPSTGATPADWEAIGALLLRIEKQLATEKPTGAPADLSAQLDKLRQRLTQIEMRLNELEAVQRVPVSRVDTPKKEGYYKPVFAPARPTVILYNSTPRPVDFFGNGQTLRIEPGQTLRLDNVPTGPFVHEVAWAGEPVRQVRTAWVSSEGRHLTIH